MSQGLNLRQSFHVSATWEAFSSKSQDFPDRIQSSPSSCQKPLAANPKKSLEAHEVGRTWRDRNSSVAQVQLTFRSKLSTSFTLTSFNSSITKPKFYREPVFFSGSGRSRYIITSYFYRVPGLSFQSLRFYTNNNQFARCKGTRLICVLN